MKPTTLLFTHHLDLSIILLNVKIEQSDFSPQLVSQDTCLGLEAARRLSRVRKPPERYDHNIYDT